MENYLEIEKNRPLSVFLYSIVSASDPIVISFVIVNLKIIKKPVDNGRNIIDPNR